MVNKKAATYFKIIFMSIFIAVLLAEIYIRLFSEFGYETPAILKSESLQFEPALFAKHVLAQKAHTSIGWNKVEWYVNEKGYRGQNFSFTKPLGTTRIIFYGGSFVFDICAAEGEDWPHIVEETLKRDSFQNVEVINAGITAHTTIDSFGRLLTEGHLLRPDYVVLCNAWNDIKYFDTEEPFLRAFDPYDPSKDFRITYSGIIDRILCNISQLYVRLRYRYYSWKYNLGMEGVAKAQSKDKSSITDLALNQYKLNIEMFVDCARNIGAIPVLMTQVRLVNRHNNISERDRIAFERVGLTHEALCYAFDKTDEILFEVAKEKNVPVIDLRAYFDENRDLFFDHIHFTVEGSEVFGALVAKDLEAIIGSNKIEEE